MDKEEYYKRIEKINDKFKTDRVSVDEEYQLVCQRNYLSTKYIKNLEQQCKKQKEVIDKVVECLNLWQIPECDKGTMREILFNTNKQNVLDILNEVLK